MLAAGIGAGPVAAEPAGDASPAPWVSDVDPRSVAAPAEHRPEQFVASPELLAQAGAQRLSDQIVDAVERSGYDGFLGTAVAPDALTLHWRGELPAEIAGLVEAAGVEVTVRSASFSRAEAYRTIEDLLGAPPATLGADVTRAGIASDFGGIEVFVSPQYSSRLATGELPLSHQGIPVGWSVAAEAEPAVGRWFDEAPFFGGSSIYRQVSADEFAYCTTAFSVRDIVGTDGLLTADHCGIGQWRVPASGELLGTSVAADSGLDAMMLGGRTYAAGVYVGDYLSASWFDIRGATNPAHNSLVYPQGAWSGGSELRVTAVDQFLEVDGLRIGPGFITEHPGRVPSVGQGDSGGPVITPNATAFEATARGLIVAVYAPFSFGDDCQGLTDDTRVCSYLAFHTNIDAIEAQMAVTVKTS